MPRYTNGGGTPPTFGARTIATLASAPRVLHVADVDANGLEDIVCGGDGGVTLFLNGGGGTPSFTAVVVTAAGSIAGVQAVDLDGDGRGPACPMLAGAVDWP